MVMLLWIIGIAKAAAVAVSITSVSDLDFGVGVQGDPPKTVLPGTSETTENGSFLVTGDPNKAYSIALPNGSINLSVTTGNAKLKVNNFTSFPSEGAHGVLDSSGKQTIYIGATRAAVPNTQKKGKYIGSYVVTVRYQ